MKKFNFLLSLFLAFVFLSCSKTSSNKNESEVKEKTTATEKSKSEENKTANGTSNKPKGQSLNILGTNIIFGSSSSDFLKANPDYKSCPQDNSFKSIRIYCKEIQNTDDNGNMTWFKTYLSFYNDELFEFNINERWSAEKYVNAMEKLVKEFKVTKEENNEEEGWFKQEISKENLKGSYGGDSDGMSFICYDSEIMKKVKNQYSDYENNL